MNIIKLLMLVYGQIFSLIIMAFYSAKNIYKNKLKSYEIDKKYKFITGNPLEKPSFRRTLKDLLVESVK